jgi:hypothetical protein
MAKLLSRRSYSEEEVEPALVAVALCGRNTHLASREPSADGLKVPHPTLQKSKPTRGQRYNAWELRDNLKGGHS